MRIEVTQAMIDQSRKRNCPMCPVERGVVAAIGEEWRTFAVRHEVYVRRDGYLDRHTFALPAEAQAFISLYDAGEPVTPFAFDLPLEELIGGEG